MTTMKTKTFLTMAVLTIGLTITSAMMTSCSNQDNPITDAPCEGSDLPVNFLESDLSTLFGDYEAHDGEILTGTLKDNYKISIADGATVTLSGVTINGVNDNHCTWAGITCEGDATIVLAEGTTNTVKGFHQNYPGIFVPEGKTLTIRGAGTLIASSDGFGAGIGAGREKSCGTIIIKKEVVKDGKTIAPTIKATGGYNAAGIGSAQSAACGDIKIWGGNVTAIRGDAAACIGAGAYGTCGKIFIYNGTIKAVENYCGDGDAGAGIGTGTFGVCKDTIKISGGHVTAKGGVYSPGIGAGYYGICESKILITGGTITATGGGNGAGIGSGKLGVVKDEIAIYKEHDSTIDSLTATAGCGGVPPIGKGLYDRSSKGIYIDGDDGSHAGTATENLNWTVNTLYDENGEKINQWILTRK